ncbi:MAG: hypothetical protein Q9218_000886 [Villophora microphyllina]
MAFNPKGLTYDSNEPAFLRKLRGEFGGSDTARSQRQQPRPRQTNVDEEDEPVYVHDENPHTPISRADYEALMKVPNTDQPSPKEAQAGGTRAANNADTETTVDAASDVMGEVHSRQENATIGGISKKRTAKKIEEDASADEAHPAITRPRAMKKQGSKKGKKPKLSFQDD